MISPVTASMPISRLALLLIVVPLGGCGSVAVPQESYYRLSLPAVQTVPIRSAHVLRIEGFELDSSLSSDRLLVAESPVQMRAYEFHRWVSPLNRLVQDAMLRGLTRARAFAEVKGPTASSGETLVLTGRILDFHQVESAGEWAGRITLSLRLVDATDQRVVVLEEFSATIGMPDETPAAAVGALSKGTHEVLRGFLARCGAAGVFAGVARPGK